MRQFFKKHIQELEQPVGTFPWTNEEAYANFLAQTYFYVSHSTRLLAVASARFPLDQQKLHHRFVEHIREENSHELLALRDLKALGRSISDYSEAPCTSAFYESQYYKIEHQDPTALLGYILALEGISVLRMGKVYKTLVQAHGPKTSTFIQVHAEEDISHLDKAFAQLESLNGTQLKVIENNFVQSCKLYGLILLESARAAVTAPEPRRGLEANA